MDTGERFETETLHMHRKQGKTSLLLGKEPITSDLIILEVAIVDNTVKSKPAEL